MSPLILAHGVGRTYELPIPLAYYLLGAGATVLVSFVIRALARTTAPLRDEKRVAGAAVALWLTRIAQWAALLLLGLLLVSGLLVRSDGFTFTTLGFWVGLIVGTTALSALMAGLWEQADPWASIERFYRLEEAEDKPLGAPWWVGPALLFLLFWFELVSGVGFTAFWVVVALIGYSIFSFTLRSRLGEERWSLVDPLAILFGFAARIAPLRITRDGVFHKGVLRDLEAETPMPKALFAAVFVLLASTTLDNVKETVGWTSFRASTGLDAVPDKIVETVALAAFTLPFFLTFLAAVAVSRSWFGNGSDVRAAARRLGWSLIPIGVAYVLAHNAPLIMTGVPELLRELSDPFERGWNLLGTSHLFEGFLPSPKLVWFLEIALIVGGHIIGVLAAHRAAVQLAPDHRSAVKSQYALTALMSGYTIVTLWLLAQPLVT